MTITIKESDGSTLKIRFPLWLIRKRLICWLIRKNNGKALTTGKVEYSNPMTYIKGSDADVARFIGKLKQFARNNPGWVLVECIEEDGDYVKVEL